MMNQSELYLMITVTGRAGLPDFIRLFRDKGLETHFISLGHGTAGKRYMRLLALNETEKTVCMTVVTGRKWLEVKKALTVRLRIDTPGVGVAFVSPLSAVGGKRELMFLTDGQGFEKGAERTLKGTEQELLVVISNQGYSEQIMDAARKADVRGGTVIHARGTGQEKAERFMGISLASEKDVILIVTPSEKKEEMIRHIIHDAGPSTSAGAIAFALPVTDTAGMVLRPQSEELSEEDIQQAQKAEAEKAEPPAAEISPADPDAGASPSTQQPADEAVETHAPAAEETAEEKTDQGD